MLSSRVYYPTHTNLIFLHGAVKFQHDKENPGEPMLAGIREQHLMASAVGAAQNYPGDVLEKAAVLLRSMIKNHPFVDGNKRTAILTVFAFLKRNGYEPYAPAQRWTNIATSVAEQPGGYPVSRLRRSLTKCVRRIQGGPPLLNPLLAFVAGSRERLFWVTAMATDVVRLKRE